MCGGMRLTIELRRIGASRVGYHAIPIIARVRSGTTFGADILARQSRCDVEGAKNFIQGWADDKFRAAVSIVWEDRTDE